MTIINYIDLLECSCDRLMRERTSLSSVIGEDFHNYSLFEEKMDMESVVYDSEDDNLIQYAHSNEPLNYDEMPTSVCEGSPLNFLMCPKKLMIFF